MATTYKTPGVYIEEISKFPPSIAEVETAIPAFVGYTEIAKYGAEDFHADPTKRRPIRITSLLEYELYFGKAKPETTIEVVIKDTKQGDNLLDRKANARIKDKKPSPNILYYAMQAFFANGGGPCYIVSVGPMNGTIELAAMQAALAEVEKEDEVTLLVFPESLSLSDADYASLMSDALNQCGKLQDRFTVMDLKPLEKPKTILDAANTFRDLSLPLDNLKYGAIYTPSVETVFNYLYTEDQVKIFRMENDAAEAEQGNMASFNPATTAGADGTQYALIKAAIDQMPLVLPPSPLVVGQYASTDNGRGVWKAPANVALASVIKPTIKITREEQDQLNVHSTGKSVNAIRAFTGRGTLIGCVAKTLK